MASVKKQIGKDGKISFKITVFSGVDGKGRQIRHYSTYVPEAKMTERQAEKAAQRAAFQFEEKLKAGFVADDRQTFEQYAQYVLDLKRQAGCKYRTLERYGELLERINPAIGHLKLSDIRPQHLNAFYKNLSEPGVSDRGAKARLKEKSTLPQILKERKISRKKAGEAAGVSASTISALCNGRPIEAETAIKLVHFLKVPEKDHLVITSGEAVLSSKTVAEHHRLIHTILANAERELIIPYNPADKAVPPKLEKKDPNYFQPETVTAILEALESEPLKWKCLVNLALVSGCRRGELAGLQWDKVDFDHSRIRIDTTVQYSAKRKDRVFLQSPKTKDSNRYITLPAETMEILRQYRLEYLRNKLLLGEEFHDCGFVFPRENGEPMAPDIITSWMAKFSNRHGLPHLNPHALRHTMTSLLISGGLDIVSVSKRLGHAQTSTTANIYAHMIEEQDSKSAECIADSIFRKKDKIG